MSAWWGWMGHETRRAATSRPEGVETDPNATDEIPGRNGTIQRPTGRLTWIVHTPSGAKTIHPTEAAAKLRAAESDGAVWYPALVEVEEMSA